jgi:hypothetical protein
MNTRRLTSLLAAATLTGTALVGATGATQAASDSGPLGTTSLATVLAADGHGFDHNRRDFDLVDRFVSRVLAAKPHSDLAILTHGRRHVTAFLPTDGAFRRAAVIIVGKRFTSERKVFRALMKAGGVGGVENVLLHHLVKGETLTTHDLRAAAPTRLTTMQGGTLRIRIRDGRIVVIDHDPASPNAHVLPALSNINKGNRQIAHGITAVLSPA